MKTAKLTRGIGLLLLGLLLGLEADAAVEPRDEKLKALLVEALAESDRFADRFEAEVWLTDMSGRLQRRLPESEERLNLLKLIHLEAARVQLPPELLLAVIQVESNFDRFAISEAGARGLMQVMPFWLKEIGRPHDNLFNVSTNLRMGSTILRYYLDLEKGNLTRALARYNGSLGRKTYPDKVFHALRLRWQRD